MATESSQSVSVPMSPVFAQFPAEMEGKNREGRNGTATTAAAAAADSLPRVSSGNPDPKTEQREPLEN